MSTPPALPADWDDPDWCERQYNPRLTVADAADRLAGWGPLAQAARRSHPPMADIAYGAHPRERIDLFRAGAARGLLIFIHGGYWRALSKDEHSWVAGPFLAAGYSVALINYPLCPEVTVADIAASCQRAIAHLWSLAAPEERAHMVVSGHSAGGYLTAALFATDWTALGLPDSPFCGGLSISGVFDPRPLINTSMNTLIRLTPESAAALNLMTQARRVDAPLILTVGGDEPAEFHRQSRDLATAWGLAPAVVRAIAGTNHFTILDQLREAQSPMVQLATALLDGAAA